MFMKKQILFSCKNLVIQPIHILQSFKQKLLSINLSLLAPQKQVAATTRFFIPTTVISYLLSTKELKTQ